MFEHLNEDLIYEYLDGALTASQCAWVDSHLESCWECVERLAQTQGIFLALESLPDVALERDLTSDVLAGLHLALGSEASGIGSLRWVFLAQVLVALVLLAVVWPTIARQLPIGPAVWLVERARLAISQEIVD